MGAIILKQTLIGIFLILLCMLDLWLIGRYDIVRILATIGDPVVVPMLLGGVGLCVGIVGFCMLIGDDKKL
jgi:hypothetical protein